MVDFFLNQMILSNPVLTWVFFIAAYAILGGGIKYIDDAFDEQTFRVRNALLLAPVLGVFWAYTMSLSPASSIILGAIALGVLFKGKIDNIAHQLGIISIFVVLVLFGVFSFLLASPFMILVLILLVIAGILDEFGNDFVDKHLETPKPIFLFFEYRFVMKLAVLAFVLLGIFEWVFFFAFLAFDIAYALVMKYSTRVSHERKFYYHKNPNGISGNHNEKRRDSKKSGRFASP